MFVYSQMNYEISNKFPAYHPRTFSFFNRTRKYKSMDNYKTPPSSISQPSNCNSNLLKYSYQLSLKVCSFTRLTMSLLIGRNDLRKIFEKLDKNNDGFVCLDELNWLLDKISVHLTLAELGTMVGKPTLDFNEFLFFYESISDKKNGDSVSGGGKYEKYEEIEREVDMENDLVEAFKVFDMNNDGFISSDELQSVLSRLGLWDETGGRDCRNMIRAYDINQDGRLDFEEFKNMMMLTIS